LRAELFKQFDMGEQFVLNVFVQGAVLADEIIM
jgi:hypothetical protein